MVNENVPQREIERQTGLSRPYIRKVAREVGYQFPRNGFEVIGNMCMCVNCGAFFRRPTSKIERAKQQFCDVVCKQAFFAGPNHPSWSTGVTARSFSTWVVNQSGYKKWKEAVLERDGYACVISGRKNELHAHHIVMKALDPSMAFNIDNGITLNEQIHIEIHKLIREGVGFEEAIQKLKDKHKEEREKSNSDFNNKEE
jgi:hypothetical protein